MAINKKNNVLICWVGGNDLKSAEGAEAGPILSTLRVQSFDSVELLYNYPANQVKPFLGWLKTQTSIPINAHHEQLTSPINFGEIYQAANKHLVRLDSENTTLSILLSPGTPAMQAVWILLGKTRFPSKFYQSSIEQGVQQVEIPFEISAEYTPIADTISSDKLIQLARYETPIDAAFDNIITQNRQVHTLKAQAQILAQTNVPVLIYGETGTGKELFARAIHNASPRKNNPFIAVNCGAFPRELIDSILFGHKKGAFTGAIADKLGVFQQANGGTLFLDEFGELEPEIQVRLLRVLQEGAFTPVGALHEQQVDVRVITATHRNLMELVAKGQFREDLFYRVAVGVLHLPPLRERDGDVLLLAKSFLEGMAAIDELIKHKNISVEARNIILRHPWKGNVRELHSTLLRAVLWSHEDILSADDLKHSLFDMPEKNPGNEMLDLSQGIDIQYFIGDISRRYIQKALEITNHNKTRSAELLGLKNYQTLKNWMDKYGIK